MILQALTQLYEDLLARGDISPPGWGLSKISYGLRIDENGTLIRVIPLTETIQRKDKTVFIPQKIELPAAVKRSSGLSPNFLWDNSSYLLGISDKGNAVRAKECFWACEKLHRQILGSLTCTEAKAVLRFLTTWDPEHANEHPALSNCFDELISGANILFLVNDNFPHEHPDIRRAWQAHYDRSNGAKATCMVTGQMDEIVPIHPSIKGVYGAQSTGASLVSFNAPAFCSYGKEQNFNSPIGKKAAFAYTTALNYLLADRSNVRRIGDTCLVCWADGADPVYTRFTQKALFGEQTQEDEPQEDIGASIKRLSDGLPCHSPSLDPNKTFYILGLSPNAARLSVRFFLRDTFGSLMRNINEHHKSMEIAGNRYSVMPLWAILQETVNKNAKDDLPSPVMAGAVARAIFTGVPYPASLLEAVMIRIRSEHNITPGKAAVLKGYFLRNPNPNCPKEVLTVSLNENSTNIPYTLGRLFSIYEAVQRYAIPGINTTIKDRFFNSAAASPARIFPLLDSLSQKHLRKLDIGLRIHFEQQIAALKNILGEENPTQLSLPEQGSFNLGYYHQSFRPFTNKEEE